MISMEVSQAEKERILSDREKEKQRADFLNSRAIKNNQMHQKIRGLKKGDKIYFKSPYSGSTMMTDFSCMNIWKEVTHATVFHYQPRKRVLWLAIPEGQLDKGQWRDNLQPLHVSECVARGLMVTQPM